MTKFEILTAPMKAAHQLMMMIARILDAILRMLFGPSAPSLARRLPQLSTKSEDVIDAYKNTLSGLSGRALKMASNVGRSIHMYAKEPLVRAAVDLSGLSVEQQDWLMSLSDGDSRALRLRARSLAIRRRQEKGADSSGCQSLRLQQCSPYMRSLNSRRRGLITA